MFDYTGYGTPAQQPAVIWWVTIVLVVAAVIDGWKLKVPNWLTFPFAITGWVFSTATFGIEGLGYSLIGTIIGLALLMPFYMIGGMGAGDVKLLAGVGTWVWGTATFFSFCATAIVGGVLAVAMVLIQKSWTHHRAMFFGILSEIATVRDPSALAVIAAERKSTMLLLPYGIPMAIGTIGFFVMTGLLG